MSARIIIPRKNWKIEDRVNELVKLHPHRSKLNAGAAHWTAGRSDVLNHLDKKHYHFIIDKYNNIWANYAKPHQLLYHTYMRNSESVGIALAGMHGTNSTIWDRHKFDNSKYKHMVTKSQYELMCFMFAFCSIWYNIPVQNIKTHAEYAKEWYPKYPRGYYPDRWDLKDMGKDMRSKIVYYKVKINEVLNK